MSKYTCVACIANLSTIQHAITYVFHKHAGLFNVCLYKGPWYRVMTKYNHMQAHCELSTTSSQKSVKLCIPLSIPHTLSLTNTNIERF